MNDDNTWETKRQKLIKKLKDQEGIFALKQLMREMEYSNKRQLINDIESITKTLFNERILLEIDPPNCISCGFVFQLKKGAGFKIPSKCPKCKHQRIDWPSIRIKKI